MAPDRTTRSFNSEGDLTLVTTGDGEEVTITRTAEGRLSTVESDDYALTFSDTTELNSSGNPVTGTDGLIDLVEDSRGRRVTYGYALDTVLNTPVLATVSAPHLVAAESVTPRPYGLRKYVTSKGRVDQIVEEIEIGRDHQLVVNTYDTSGRVESQVSADGDVAEFHYGMKPHPTTGVLEAAPGFTTVEDTFSEDVIVYAFDSQGRTLGATDATGNATSRDWDSSGQQGDFTSRSGVIQQPTYDAAGRLVELEEVAGASTRTVKSFEYVALETDPGASTDLRLSSSTDAAGVQTSYVYEVVESGSADLPWKVEAPCDQNSLADGLSCPGSGRVATTYTYVTTAGLVGLVESVTDPDGVRTEYTYHDDRSVASSTIFENPTTPLTTTYETILPGDPGWSESAPAARVEVVTNPAGEATETVYDAAGRPVLVRDPLFDGVSHFATEYEYWLNGDLKSVTDPSGESTAYDTYRPSDPGWSEASEIASVTVVTDPDGVSQITKTDRSGDVVVEATGDYEYPLTWSVSTNTYGPLGRLDSSTGPDGVETSYGYDVEGRVTQTTTDGATLGDPAHTTTNTYDGRGQLESVTGPEVTDPDSVTVQSETTYTYDEAGRQIGTIEGPSSDPSHQLLTSTIYDTAGKVVATITRGGGHLDAEDPLAELDPGDVVSGTRYTLAGRVAEQWTPAPNVVTLPDPFDLSALVLTEYVYDDAGRQIEVIDPLERSTVTTYDLAGRVDTVTGPGGYEMSYDYDDLGRQLAVTTPSGLTGPGDPATVTATTTYTPTGQVETQTDPHVPVSGVPDPSQRSFTYTPGGRLHVATDALGTEVTYAYDERGNRISRTALDDDSNPQVQAWEYDLANRVVTATVPAPRVGAVPQDTVYDYDPTSGLLDTVTDPSGRVQTFDYYTSGKVRSKTSTGSGLDTITETFWIDGRGNTTKTTAAKAGSATHTESSTFDRLGRPATVTSHTDDDISYTFDLAGYVDSFTYPDGAIATYERNEIGQITNIDVAADAMSMPIPWSEYTYDTAGRQTEMLSYASGGNTRSYDYDPAGRLIEFDQAIKRAGGGWNTYTADLTWRPDGRLESANDGTNTTVYDYDDAGQLTSATGGAVNQTWTYGTRGNRLTSTRGATTTTYVTNPNGSIAEADDGTNTTTYDYDDAGRRLQATTTAGATTTRTVTTDWDAAGRLEAITATTPSTSQFETRRYNPAGLTTEYVNNAFFGTHTWDAIWDTTQAVPHVINGSIDGNLYTRADYANERVSIKFGSTLSWFEYDEHHSVINSGSANGAIASGPASYDPYGNPSSATSSGFAYRSESTTLGLIYLRNRTYDPGTGAFLAQDPLDGVDGSPTVASGYHYSDNDPLNKIDPLGLRPCDGSLSCIVIPEWVVRSNVLPCESFRPVLESADRSDPTLWGQAKRNLRKISFGCRVYLHKPGKGIHLDRGGRRFQDDFGVDLGLAAVDPPTVFPADGEEPKNGRILVGLDYVTSLHNRNVFIPTGPRFESLPPHRTATLVGGVLGLATSFEYQNSIFARSTKMNLWATTVFPGSIEYEMILRAMNVADRSSVGTALVVAMSPGGLECKHVTDYNLIVTWDNTRKWRPC